MGIPEEEKDKEKDIWRNNGQNFLKLIKNINLHIKEAQPTLNIVNLSKPGHIIIKLLKAKDIERISKATREETSHVQGILHEINR